MSLEHIRSWTIGEVEVTRIVEVNNHVDPLAFLLEGGSRELMKQYDWLFPHFSTPEGDLMISFQCFVVETPGRRIMIDTCIGNDRWREHAIFNDMQTSFLQDLEHAGYPPESIDTVLCTHLHFDHVGWNTRKRNGEWVPTFPNARYLLGRTEWDHWKQVPRDGTVHAQHLVDSIQPILDAKLTDFIESDHRVCDEIRLLPTPGHTPGHVSVHIRSQGQEAVITGDMMHHPIQIARPLMPANFCMDKSQACQTRKAFVDRFGGSKVLIIGSHFCDPTVGWIERDKDNWRFRIKED